VRSFPLKSETGSAAESEREEMARKKIECFILSV
jgi:hypothetical protein